jgi:virulence factor Mce-like protein
MRRILASAAVLAAVVVFMVVALGSGGSSSSSPTYKIELQNAFGLVNGSQFMVAGVPAGKITKIDVCAAEQHAGCQNKLDALVTVQVTQTGFGQFHQDVSCQSRPQSLIGEYFLTCDPGSSGPVWPTSKTIPVTKTFSTIPMDLVNNIMRLPYRERFTLIINELGAAVAGRSGDLQAALQRAVPALDETDNLLTLLANDSRTINNLNANANTVITTLANNSKVVQNFIDQANTLSKDSAAQAPNISKTWAQLPGFLEQLRPAMAQLSAAADANLPVVQNLNAASGGLNRLFHDLPPFSNAALPATRALGKASVPGRTAVIAARPTVADLRQFTGPSGCDTESYKSSSCLTELGHNLSIILHDLDNRSRAVEPDKRSPGGKGYTGLEALLQYVFNQALAINTFNALGHLLAVDAFIDPVCSPYASPQFLANNLATYGSQARRCYAWLGPNQPGVNETDPTDPGACVPDPGGAPPGQRGPATSACRLQGSSGGNAAAADTSGSSTPLALAKRAASSSAHSTSAAGGGSPGSGGGGSGGSSGAGSGAGSAATQNRAASSSTPGSSASQAVQLLNYLLAP